MKLVILGANGKTGRHVVRTALEHGMHVTAVVRDPARSIGFAHDRLKIEIGDPCDPVFLTNTFRGKDAVISTLGGRRPTKAATSVCYRSANAIVEAAWNTGLQRVLVTSTALLFREQPFIGKLLRLMVPNVVSSARRMEGILKSSGVNWTIVRAGFLNDGNESRFQQQREAAPAHCTSVSRRALANFLVSALKDPETERGVYGIATGLHNATPSQFAVPPHQAV